VVVVLFLVVVGGTREPQCGVVIVMLSVTEPKSETPSEPVTVTSLTVGDSQGLINPHMHLSFLHSDFSTPTLSQSATVGNGPQEFGDGTVVDVGQYGKSPKPLDLRWRTSTDS
jgi:hypothetical protein